MYYYRLNNYITDFHINLSEFIIQAPCYDDNNSKLKKYYKWSTSSDKNAS